MLAEEELAAQATLSSCIAANPWLCRRKAPGLSLDGRPRRLEVRRAVFPSVVGLRAWGRHSSALVKLLLHEFVGACAGEWTMHRGKRYAIPARWSCWVPELTSCSTNVDLLLASRFCRGPCRKVACHKVKPVERRRLRRL